MIRLFCLLLALAGPVAAQTFPTVTADDLNGISKTLPAGLPGDPTIVFIAYKRNQQADVDSWVTMLGLDPERGAEYVELPVVGGMTKMMRGFVDNGMRSGITNTAARARTITLYEDASDINAPLGFEGRDMIRVLVVKRDGTVLWSTSGPATVQGVAEVQSVFR